MATLKDIAAELGLSPSTVSRALAGHPHVDEATRTAIFRTATRLGYQPNAIARALRRQSTQTIGLVIPSILSDFFALSATSIQRAAEQSGYQVMLCVTADDPAQERQYLDMLAAHKVAGIIHTPCTERGAAHLRQHTPVVELARQSDGRQFDAVVAADRDGAEEAIRHLVELGHERIAMVAGWSKFSTIRERFEGYKSAMTAAGLPIIDDLVKVGNGNLTREWGRQAMAELLALPDRPTAVFAAGAQLTLGVFETLREAELACPDDLSVVAFEDPPWFAVWTPGITAYSAPMTEMGFLAMQLLLRRIRGEAADGPDVTVSRLSGVLRVRGSTQKNTAG